MKIRLTENELKQIVNESVKKILEESTCWYGDTKPFEIIYQMADKIATSLESKFTPEYYEGWPDDFSYEDMCEWAKKVRDDAGEYINCNSQFISTALKRIESDSFA